MSDDTKQGSALPWIVVLLAVAGGAAWWFMGADTPAPADAPEPAAAEAPAEPAAEPEPAAAAAPEAAPAADPEPAAEPEPAAAPAPAPEPEEAAAVAPEPEPEVPAKPIDRERIYFPTADGIREALQAHKQEVQGCFEGWIASQPELEKGAAVSFIIHSSARGDGLAALSKVAFKSLDLEHVFMEGCVGDVVNAIRFAVPEEDVFVDEPMM